MSESTKRNFLNPGSRIFWKIAAGIFISILMIESVLLLYSWFTERSRLLTRTGESLATVVSLLDDHAPAAQLERLLSDESPVQTLKLVGFNYQQADGIEIQGGETASILTLVNANKLTHYDSTNNRYTQYFPADGTHDSFRLRVDTSWINSYMRTYVWRILGMVTLISLFVTIACLILLKPLLINPLERLDQLLVRGQKRGIGSATPESRDVTRADELGSVFRSFEHLRSQLVSAEVEKALISTRFEEFANLGADCFWEVDTDMRFTYAAGDTLRVFGVRPEEIMGRPSSELLDALGTREGNDQTITATLRHEGEWEGTIYPESLNSEETAAITVRMLSIPFRADSGNIIGYRGTVTDISEETRLSAELTYQATHDELTGLSNRREMANQLQLSIEKYRASGENFALLALDLDRFKLINDSCGHAAGDMLLRSLAVKLLTVVDENDKVARMGGDEFAVLLRDSDAQRSEELAEKIRMMIADFRFIWNNETHRFSASIGVAQASDELLTQEALTFAADTCCLSAKRNGKNQVIHYSNMDSDLTMFRDEAEWISRIMYALENDQFSLFRQTISPVLSKQPEDHFEILLRMENGEGGYWPPNLFLGAAERNDLMPEVDAWVVNKSLEWLEKQTLSDDIDFCMNINLSGASLSDSKFREFLLQRVADNSQLNRYICFEMTETVAMASFDETVALLDKLKLQGCKVALDDFGTGFSSLSHIRDLPLDYIKIDGTFIRDIVNNELDQTVVKSVADIARVLNIKTVAEFVEDEETLKLLEDMEIDYAQGYLFAKPEPLDDTDNADGYSAKAA